MSNQKRYPTSGDLFITLHDNKRNILNKPKPEHVAELINTIQQELLMNFHSPLLDACFSVWKRFALRVGISDGNYHVSSFRLAFSNEPYPLSSYDAHCILSILADAVHGQDNKELCAKWLSISWNKKNDYPTPANGCIDTLLKRIDEGMIQLHRRYVKHCNNMMAIMTQNPDAQQILRAAQMEADDIICEAKASADDLLNRAQHLQQKANVLRDSGEKAARDFYIQAEKAEAQRKKEAQDTLDAAVRNAKKLKDNATQQAAQIVEQAHVQADAIVAKVNKDANRLTGKAKAKANEIVQDALQDQYLVRNSGLKEGIQQVLAQFLQTQEAMRALEVQFDQTHLLTIFESFYSLYDLIDLSKNGLQSLPEEYGYIRDNMDTFLEIIQESLTNFGIKTIVTAPDSPFDGHIHKTQDKTMFDPATATIKQSLRPGFMNTATGNVLEKEHVTIN